MSLTLPNYAALTALSPDSGYRAHNAAFRVLGKESPGDGAQGDWYFDAASAAAPDGGTVLAPDSGEGRFFRLLPLPGVYFTSWWTGADIDVTPALVAASACVNARPCGGKILIASPSGGALELRAAVTMPCTSPLEIEGIGAPIIMHAGAAHDGLIFGDAVMQRMSQVRVRNFRMWGAGDEGTVAFRAMRLPNLKFEGVRTYKWGKGGLHATHCYTIQINDTRWVDDASAPTGDFGVLLDGASMNGAAMNSSGAIGFKKSGAAGLIVRGRGYGMSVSAADFEENAEHIRVEVENGEAIDGLYVGRGSYFEAYDFQNPTPALTIADGVPARNIVLDEAQLLNATIDIKQADGVSIGDGVTAHHSGTAIDFGTDPAKVKSIRLGNIRRPNNGAILRPDNREWQSEPEWTPFTPIWTCASGPPILGNGVLSGRYKRSGNTVDVEYMLEMAADGSTWFGIGASRFSLPFPAKNISPNKVWTHGDAWAVDVSSPSQWKMALQPIIYNAGTFCAWRNEADASAVTATSPFVFASGDRFGGSVRYECA